MFTGYIYRIHNLITGKSYIGQTTRTVNERVYEHLRDSENGCNLYIHKTIKKYGIESFNIITIHIINCKTKEELQLLLNNLEIKEIEKYDSFNNGYNLTIGGSCKMPEEAIIRRSKTLKENFTEAHRSAISKASKGKIISEETRDKIRQANIGKTHSSETKEKNRQKQLLNLQDEKYRKKQSEAVKKWWKERKENMASNTNKKIGGK